MLEEDVIIPPGLGFCLHLSRAEKLGFLEQAGRKPGFSLTHQDTHSLCTIPVLA